MDFRGILRIIALVGILLIGLTTAVYGLALNREELKNPLNKDALYGDGSSAGELDFPTGIDEALAATCLDSYLNSVAPTSPLKGKGARFVSAGKQYNVNPALLIAIAGIESSFATKNIDKLNYNFVNIRPTEGGGFMSYGSWEEGIDAEAELLGKFYIHSTNPSKPPTPTIAEIAEDWAPPEENDTKGWIAAVTKYFGDIQRHCPTLVVTNTDPGGAGGATSNEAAKTLADWVRANPTRANQCLNGTGNTGCLLTVDIALSEAFPGSNPRGAPGGGDAPMFNRGRVPKDGEAPNAHDIRVAQETLSKGQLPVWHIRGHGTGQHWIVILGINGSDITFFDPEVGEVRTANQMLKERLGYYFGYTVKGSADESLQRGFPFTPPAKQ